MTKSARSEAPPKNWRTGRQAYVLIHGIGEQTPMVNIREFVQAVWEDDPSVRNPHAEKHTDRVWWSHPDGASANYETRRLTTISNTKGVKTDFFELYWAHLMTGNKLWHVKDWAWKLARRQSEIPGPLRPLWYGLLALYLIAAAAAVVALIFPADAAPAALKWITTAAAIIAGVLGSRFFVFRVGDAARYLNPAPPNIHRRFEIRTAGLQLLERLRDSGRYERIVVVGHSLGSIIGYDILRLLWAQTARDHSSQLDHLRRLEEMISAPGELDLDQYQQLQSDVFEELRDAGINWPVSDFVTLGSPLTYADLLMASSTDDFRARIDEREFPACPPVTEDSRVTYGDPYPKPHHAALFAATRWTNLYSPPKTILVGDVISGPLQRNFGRGIRDIPVDMGSRRLMTHTYYWKPTSRKAGTQPTCSPPEPHIAALREAVAMVR